MSLEDVYEDSWKFEDINFQEETTEFESVVTSIENSNTLYLQFDSCLFGDGQIEQILSVRSDFKTLIFYDEDAIAIANHIEKNPHLESLDLFTNQIGPVGADAIIKVLRSNLQFKNLSLAQNEIGKEAAKELCEIARNRPEGFEMKTLILSSQYDMHLEDFYDLKCLNQCSDP